MVLTYSVACLCLLFASSSARPTRRQEAKHINRVIVFGDSFSDNGNGAWVASNHTWPADPAYFNHSFSNGPVWAETLSKALNAELLDYAAGGATADNSFVAGFTGPQSTIPVPSAYDQLQTFLNLSVPQPGDVFVHWIGANDILFNTSITGTQLTSLINRDVDLLYRSGAKTVLMANYPPLNELPATYGMSAYDSAGTFAETLTQGLENVAAGWQPYMSIGTVNIQSFFADIFANPEAYGIDEKYVNPPTSCLKGAYPSEGVPRSLCNDPEKHLFFDVYHPVTQVHSRIAALFQDVLARL